MDLEKLKENFYYVQVKDQYDVIRAHDLFSKIGVEVFKDDGQIESFLKRQREKEEPVKDNWLIKDGDGWRIQSHFIATDHTTEELEKEINIYLRSLQRDSLDDTEREMCEKLATSLSNELDAFACYIHQYYHNIEDINDIMNNVKHFLNDVTKDRYNRDYDKFKNSDDFQSKLNAFLREVKLNKII